MHSSAISSSSLCFALALLALPAIVSAQDCRFFESVCGTGCITRTSSCCGGEECGLTSTCFEDSICCRLGSEGLCDGKCLSIGASCCGGTECGITGKCFEDSICCEAGTQLYNGTCLNACDGVFNSCGAGKLCQEQNLFGGGIITSCSINNGICESGCVEGGISVPAAEKVDELPAIPAEAAEAAVEQPAVPMVEGPAEAAVEDPAEPTVEDPADPTVEAPAEAAVEEPAEPMIEEPAEPRIEEPAEPTIEELVEPTIDKLDEPSTVDELAEPRVVETIMDDGSSAQSSSQGIYSVALLIISAAAAMLTS